MTTARAAFALIALACSEAAAAAPLTVPTGESWIFAIADGQPVHAHKVHADSEPRKGQVMVTVRALLGTSMIVINNSRQSYTFNAELMKAGKATTARSCVLPANGKPALEHWSENADAVRLGNFRASGMEGRC